MLPNKLVCQNGGFCSNEKFTYLANAPPSLVTNSAKSNDL